MSLVCKYSRYVEEQTSDYRSSRQMSKRQRGKACFGGSPDIKAAVYADSAIIQLKNNEDVLMKC